MRIRVRATRRRRRLIDDELFEILDCVCEYGCDYGCDVFWFYVECEEEL